MSNTRAEFEYDQIMRSYHEYFQIAAKGIVLVLLVIGACLTLPNTLTFNSSEAALIFKEVCRIFAIALLIIALSTYMVASIGFWSIHRKARQIATQLDLAPPTTWIMPVAIWIACSDAIFLILLILKYM